MAVLYSIKLVENYAYVYLVFIKLCLYDTYTYGDSGRTLCAYNSNLFAKNNNPSKYTSTTHHISFQRSTNITRFNDDDNTINNPLTKLKYFGYQ